MLYIDQKYLNLLSGRLEHFRWKSESLANCRCPICGDSSLKKNKSRLYFYEKEDRLVVHCHNSCGSMSFSSFLKRMDVNLFNEYKFEVFGPKILEKKKFKPKEDKDKIFAVETGTLKLLQNAWKLPPEHTCFRYIQGRKIPKDIELYYCSEYMHWVNLSIEGKFDKKALIFDEPRLVIPHLYKGKMHACIGRSFKEKPEVKYVLNIFDESIPSVWGLDRVDWNRWVSVTEGPIDAMFLQNGIAANGGGLITKLGTFPRERIRLIFDNEPYKKEMKSNMLKAIENDFSVVIWPKKIEEKDVNAMILAGYTREKLEGIIEVNTYKGMKAKLALSNWSKV